MVSSNTQELRILPLTEDHIDALTELAGVIWRQHYPGIISMQQIEYMLAERYVPAKLRTQMQSIDVWWDQALVGARMIGYAQYELCASEPQLKVMKLNQIYVHQDYRRLGHGARMIARVEEQARSSGCSAVRLTVNKRNSNSIAAYRKNGYAIAATAVTDIGNGFVMDDYIMEKRL